MPPGAAPTRSSLRVEGRPCLVVGGGPVAARKVADLVGCGAAGDRRRPRRRRPSSTLAGAAMAGRPLRIERRPYRAGEAGGYRLVVTATGLPEVDGAVAADAEAAGVWVNSADDADHCTFLLPSVHRDGPVTIAVSTGGASPALATWLRRRIGAAARAPTSGTLAALLEEARRACRPTGARPSAVDWQALLDGAVARPGREGRLDAARPPDRGGCWPRPPRAPGLRG